jgi:hypothetical protein
MDRDAGPMEMCPGGLAFLRLQLVRPKDAERGAAECQGCHVVLDGQKVE